MQLIIDGHPAMLSQREFASFHGESVFTTLCSRKGELLLWERHWRRVCEHARILGFIVPEEKTIRDILCPIIAMGDKKIRVILSRSRFALTIEPYEPPCERIYKGVRIIESSWKVHPQLAHLKTGNSLPYTMAHNEAKRSNAFEALLSDCNGFIVDGSRTSLLHYDGQELVELIGGLAGCMRACALDYAISLGIEIAQRRLKAEHLIHQLILANSLIGLVPVDSIKFDAVSLLIERFRMN